MPNHTEFELPTLAIEAGYEDADGQDELIFEDLEERQAPEVGCACSTSCTCTSTSCMAWAA